jgi:glycosyltransferase involved in cell wall biosynthesis
MIVLSNSFKTLFDGLIPPEKIKIVSNGVGIPPARRDNTKNYQRIPSKSLIVLYLGTLMRRKGVLVLLKSVPLIIAERPDIRFVFAGPWSNERDRKEAFSFIAKHGLANDVHFTGIVDERKKWDVLQASDIFVFPGIQQEGQPLVILEAMAVGLPVIYTNRGCILDIISDGNNGFQIRRNDPVDMAHKILLLASDSHMMREMGTRNRERFLNAYTDKHHTHNMLNIFEQLSN